MSYILDALKRADAERERGAVPSLHARQTTASATLPVPGRHRRAWLLTSGGLLVAMFAAAGLWRWLAPVSATGPTGADRVVVQNRPVAVATPSPVQPAPPTPPPPAAVGEVAPVPAPRAPVPKGPAPTAASKTAAADLPAPVPAPAQPPAPASAPARTTAPELAAPATPSTPAAPPVAAVAPIPPGPSPLLSELPEDIRRQIPILAISGSVYSQNPGQRMLVVNNLVLTEGSQAAPDLMLEHIQAKSAIFVFRGTRFRLAH